MDDNAEKVIKGPMDKYLVDLRNFQTGAATDPIVLDSDSEKEKGDEEVDACEDDEVDEYEDEEVNEEEELVGALKHIADNALNWGDEEVEEAIREALAMYHR